MDFKVAFGFPKLAKLAVGFVAFITLLVVVALALIAGSFG
jgi:hypothetical protein